MENKNNELTLVTEQVAKLELQLQAIKQIEEQHKQLKDRLYEMMLEYDVKKWETASGISITRVDGKEESIVEVDKFNEDTFKEEYPDLYAKYVSKITKIEKGRKGYAKITLPKVVDYERLKGGNQ